MDTSNIINLGLLGLTALGLFLAVYQARLARGSQQAADAASEQAAIHERSALEAAQRAAAAADRSADALERRVQFLEVDQETAARRRRVKVAKAMKAWDAARSEGNAVAAIMAVDAAIAEAGGGMGDVRAWMLDAVEQHHQATRRMKDSLRPDQHGVPRAEERLLLEERHYRWDIAWRLDEWTASGRFDLRPLAPLGASDT